MPSEFTRPSMKHLFTCARVPGGRASPWVPNKVKKEEKRDQIGGELRPTERKTRRREKKREETRGDETRGKEANLPYEVHAHLAPGPLPHELLFGYLGFCSGGSARLRTVGICRHMAAMCANESVFE
eukprot:1195984-Prorocentrum_minimum.AAC.5